MSSEKTIEDRRAAAPNRLRREDPAVPVKISKSVSENKKSGSPAASRSSKPAPSFFEYRKKGKDHDSL